MDLLGLSFAPDEIARRTQSIRQAVLGRSCHIREPNFHAIADQDIALLFGLYDAGFFAGWLHDTVHQYPDNTLTFRLSRTMTRAGGSTTRTRLRRIGTCPVHYQIAIASRLLFMSFADIQRPVVVSGLPCANRLDALQRIMEHEIIHLAELLEWGQSSCSAQRFKHLARNIFGHTDTTHQLVTPCEHAAEKHNIRVGTMVEFDFQGARHVGRVNRIHRRATVLVPAADGQRYTDGGTYRKYYVPLGMLRPAGERSGQ